MCTEFHGEEEPWREAPIKSYSVKLRAHSVKLRVILHCHRPHADVRRRGARKERYAARRRLKLRPPSAVRTKPIRCNAPSTEPIFATARRPWRNRAASESAPSGATSAASAAMMAAVCATSSAGKFGFGPAAGAGCAPPVSPPTRSSSAFCSCEPKRGIW